MKRIVCILVSMMMVLSLAACGGKAGTDEGKSQSSTTVQKQSMDGGASQPEPEKPLEFTVLVDAIAWTKNNLDINESEELKVWQEISNTKITFITPPHSEYGNKVSIIFASGDIPDAACLQSNFRQYSDYLIPLDEMMNKYGQSLKELYPQSAFEAFSMQGRLYGIPRVVSLYNNRGFIMRKDWLDNLGLQEPETLEDYYNVLRAFTYDDPDKNGKKDTYGATFRSGFTWMDGFRGAFGLNSHRSVTYDVVDGKLVPQQTLPKYKEYLAYMRKLWEEGLFTPNSMVNTSDQWKKEIFTGEAGMWDHMNTRIDEYFMVNFNNTLGTDSGVVLCAPKPPVGKDGLRGNVRDNPATYAVMITNRHKEPERLFRYFVWASTSDEAKEFGKYGLEGKHHKVVDGKKEWIPEILTNDLLLQIKELVYLESKYYVDDDETVAVYGERAVAIEKQNNEYNLPTYGVFTGKPVLEEEKNYPDLDKVVEEYTIKIVTGELPLDSGFEEMVNRLNKAGLDKVTADRQNWYDSVHKN